MSNPYIRLMRLDKPVGIFLLLWPALIALWIAASGSPRIKNVVIFILGVIITRSAGCVINDYADRKFDIHVARTANRPLATGEIPARNALILFAVLIFSAAILVSFTNTLTILLSLAAGLLMSIYPLVKRISNMPQFVLGLAFSWAVPMAFAAEKSAFIPASLLIMFATVSWAVAYDTIYAMVDRADDVKIGIKSSAILFGDYDRFWVGFFMAASLGFMLIAGIVFKLHPWFFAGLFSASVLGVRGQWMIKDRKPDKLFNAFRETHYQGLIVWLFTVASFGLS